MAKRSRFTPAFKAEVVIEALSGESCTRFGEGCVSVRGYGYSTGCESLAVANIVSALIVYTHLQGKPSLRLQGIHPLSLRGIHPLNGFLPTFWRC